MSDKDTIYRQVAIDALRDARHRFTVADEAGGLGTVKWSEDVIYFAAAKRVLSDLPSAQPKPGKWIVYKAPDKYHCGLVKCPFCEEEMIAEADEYNYCPNCGAKMVREDGEA